MCVLQETLRMKLIKSGKWAQHAAKRDAMRAYSKVKEVIGGGFPQNVNDFVDSAYVGNVTVGTPGQTFQVILDTGSSNFWVPDATCPQGNNCGDECQIAFLCNLLCDPSCCTSHPKDLAAKTAPLSANACDNKNKYDATKSTTYAKDGKQWNIAYGTGSAQGFQGVETVAFGDIGTNQLIVPKATFGQATDIAEFFADQPIDGILGLAFQSLSVNGVKPVFIEAIDQKLVDAPLFTVWLEHEGNQNNVNGGVYTWGAIDTVNCGDVISYQALSSATYFQFPISGVSADTYKLTKTAQVISDTGTSLLAGPPDVVDKIANAFGATLNADYGLYTLDCKSTLKPLTFTIGAIDYPISSANLIVPVPELNTCILGLEAWGGAGIGPSWILGDPFIRQYCQIYDIGNKRMGFAPSKQA